MSDRLHQISPLLPEERVSAGLHELAARLIRASAPLQSHLPLVQAIRPQAAVELAHLRVEEALEEQWLDSECQPPGEKQLIAIAAAVPTGGASCRRRSWFDSSIIFYAHRSIRQSLCRRCCSLIDSKAALASAAADAIWPEAEVDDYD